MASVIETKAVALRGGNHAASLNFTGIAKEVVVDMGTTGDGIDSTTTTLRLHNGVTAGGIPMMRADTMNMSTRVLAEGREIIGDKNLLYSDLSNMQDTVERDIRSAYIGILNSSSTWTSERALLLASKADLDTDIATAKSWVNTYFIASSNPGAPFTHTSNKITLPTTFTNTITSSGTNSFSGNNAFTGQVEIPTAPVNTNSNIAASTAFVKTAIDNEDALVVHLASPNGIETITGDKIFAGENDFTAGTIKVPTVEDTTIDNRAVSLEYLENALAALQYVRLNGEDQINGDKYFNSTVYLKTGVDDPSISPAASAYYVDSKIKEFGEDIVITDSIDDSDEDAPEILVSQEIYGDKTFTANNQAEINAKKAAIDADTTISEATKTARKAALNALLHNSTTTFNSKIISTGTNTWSGNNTFNGTNVFNTGSNTFNGTVRFNTIPTSVTPADADSSTKLATTEWVTNYAIKVQSVVSKFADAPNGAISLQYNTKIYRVTGGTVSTFTINTSNLGTLASDDALEFRLYIPSMSNCSRATWPASVSWLNGVAPTLSANRGYVLEFFSLGGGVFYGNAIGWEYALWA